MDTNAEHQPNFTLLDLVNGALSRSGLHTRAIMGEDNMIELVVLHGEHIRAGEVMADALSDHFHPRH